MKKKIWISLFALIMGLILIGCDNNTEDEKLPVVNFEESEIDLSVGNSYAISFETENLLFDVTFGDYDKSIVSVDEAGNVEAKGEGTTTITITVIDINNSENKFTHTLKVNVKDERTAYVYYYANIDGVENTSEVVKYGTNYTLKAAKEVEGYDFLGYSYKKNDTNYITEISNIKADTIVYANYKIIKDPVVSYVVNGDELTEQTVSVKKGTKVNPTLVTVSESGFAGWVSDKDLPIIITGEVEITEDTVFTAVFTKANYSISYNLMDGEWEKTYYTIDELATNFLKDYNNNGGSTSKASGLDTAYLGSNTFAAAINSETMRKNWMWLYTALCEQAGKMDTLNPETVDLTSTAAKSFYISEICGFLTKSQHTDTNYNTTSVDYSLVENQMTIIQKGPAKSQVSGPTSYKAGAVKTLVSPVRTGYEFDYWSIGGQKVTKIEANYVGDVVLVANWRQAQLPEEITFTNIPENGIPLYESLSLKWVVGPSDAYDDEVYFQALTPSIFTIDDKGVISTISKGTGSFKVKFVANPNFEQTVSINVTSGDYFDISYETTSYTTVGNPITLNSCYYDLAGTKHDVTWESLTPEIASVDSKGVVTPITTGLAQIRSKYDATHYIDFTVTVLDSTLSNELKFVLANHNSNALTVYDLNIGWTYTYDVVGSVNDLIFDDLKIDRTYYDKLPSGTKNYGVMSSVEFITVHYTGNMAKGADADNNCDYFNNLGYAASIHFVTGRSNLYASYGEDQYYAFAGLNEKYAGWHASTGQNACIWDATGVMYSSSDPEKTEISISKNNKYTINGKETQISIPTIPDGYTVNGNVLTFGGSTYTTINSMGLISKVENGQYYIARTYWGSQRSPKAICTYGGNTNSIGIESCVDIGSDLMHTWHVTAQLVAKLVKDNSLTLDRVVGHHFFSGKNCPQPMLENDMQLWYEFMDMVEAEYELLTTYSDVTLKAKAINDEGILSDKGLLKQDSKSHVVTYQVTIEKGGKKETVTLATAVESYYCFDGTRSQLSLQNQNYDIR